MDGLTDLRAFPLLLVDDEEDNLTIFRLNFKNLFTIHTASSGADALKVLEREDIAVLIVDQRMPGMTGVELLNIAHERWPKTIRVLMTAYADIDVVIEAVNEGRIYRYVTKPWNKDELKQTIRQAIEKHHMDRRYAELVSSYKSLMYQTVEALVSALEEKDAYTSGHARRITELSVAIGKEMGLEGEEMDTLRLASLLHDVGKIGVPLEVLNKPGKLTADELAVIRKHPEQGARILGNVAELRGVADAVLHHHEFWDGRGYPHGLAKEEIPTASRILAITDTYDAITSDRPYRAGNTHAFAVAEIQRCKGTQFDPKAVDALVRVFETGRIDLAQWEIALRKAV